MNRFSFEGLLGTQMSALKDSVDELPFEMADDGIRVIVCQGAVNSLIKTDTGIHLTYKKEHMFFRVLTFLPTFIEQNKEKWEEKGDISTLCYMADMSRNAVYSISAAKRMIRLLAFCGYDSMMLYTEDTYEIPEYP